MACLYVIKRATFGFTLKIPFLQCAKLHNAPDGLTPTTLYEPSVFVWLPQLLSDVTLKCKSASCMHSNVSLTTKGWNDNPIARHVVALDKLYYVITQRVQCAKHDKGCGKSWKLYDPMIMDQDWQLHFLHSSPITVE